ncbi:MAG: type II secretion system inner membrane protein GspF [Desulfococcaceae bacterium]|jgi:general secretion pathway protein F|nr:type II secretion system inner membrane protein GspF [Desulfococcaceae bacterium]
MSVYSYKATDFSGKIVKGTVDADDEKKAAGKLQEMGYIPIRIAVSGGKVGISSGVSSDFSALFQRISTKDVMLFTQDLSALLEAGLPVDRSLAILTDLIENRKFRQTVREILKSVQGGVYLSDAMSQHPKAFSKFYVNMVRAGEVGGVLGTVLERLGSFLETSQELKDYIRSALVYPLFLLFVGGISVIILLIFVIPKFSVIFADMGQAIPLSTRILLGFSELLKSYWWLLLFGCGCGIAAFLRYAGTEAGRYRIDREKIRLPVLGDLIRKIEVARFSRTMGTLMGSGVPILRAIELVRDIIGNQIIAAAMDRVYDRVKEGERLSKPLEDTQVFPALAVQMITVGEESGRLDDMLLRVAQNYEKTVRNTVKRLISLLEPVMILLMGIVVGFIVISMLMAIFSMNEIPF